MWRARRWASPYWASHQTRLGEPSNEVGRASTHWASPYWASHQRGWASQYSLGEPVLVGRTRIGRAIKRGWGEPSNEVGRASTKGWASHSTFTASTPASKLAWRGAYSACSARLLRHLLSACSAHLLSACSARLVKCQLGTVPARRCARSARLVKRSALCLLGTTYKCPLGTVPARHI